MFKTISKAFWFSFLPSCVAGAVSVYLFATGAIPLSYLWISLIMWSLISGLGIAVGYHRVFSHRTHRLPTWKEIIILFLATFGGQGGPIFWVALHRGYHHPHSDTDRDPHSPTAYSKFHAWIGWFIENTEAKNTINMKYAVDLARKKHFVWFHKWHYHILWAVPLVVLAIDWQMACAALFLPMMFGVLQDNTVNVYGHVKTFYSYRNYDTRDNSQNNALLGWFGWGQGWHNNHHAEPAKYDFGSGTSGRWWEFDPTVLFLPFIGKPVDTAR